VAHLHGVVMGNDSEGQVVGTITLKVRIGAFHCDVRFHVVQLSAAFDVILGLPWLKAHSMMDFPRNRVVLRHHNQKVTIMLTPEVSSLPAEDDDSVDKHATPVINSAAAYRMLKSGKNEGFLLLLKVPDEDLSQPGDASEPGLSDSAGQSDNQSAGQPKPSQSKPVCGMPSWEPYLEKLLAEFATVFDEPDSLPPERNVSHCVRTEPGARPPRKPSFRLTTEEKNHLIAQVQELLRKGWIQPSVSPYGAPVLFVKKKDGTLRMCIDYRALNNITVKNKYPLPRIDELLDTLQGATCFSAMDLHSGYHQVRLHPDDIAKTAFSTPTGHYEYVVIPLGLSNAPSTYQAVMNDVFRDLLGKCVLIYLDDILIYSRNSAEHCGHLKMVLERLLLHQLKAKMKKCAFFMPNVKFLGHIVGEAGTQVDPEKVAVVKNWPRPKTPGDVRSFLGLANYFRKFILGFSALSRPLAQLTNKMSLGEWGQEQEDSFQGIKDALCAAPVLAMPDNSKDFVVIADASCHSLGAVLLQEGHPVAFWSKSMDSAQAKYHTTEQELLAVLSALEHWRCYLLDKPFTVLTDHNPNTFFDTKPAQHLSGRQVRWQQRLALFNFTWEYKPGKINVADPLSRLPAGSFTAMCSAVVVLVGKLATKPVAECAVATVMAITRSAGVKKGRAGSDVKQPVKRKAGKRKRGPEQEFTVSPNVADSASPVPAPVIADAAMPNVEAPDVVMRDAVSIEEVLNPVAFGAQRGELSDLELRIARGYKEDERFQKKAFVKKLKLEHGLYWKGGRIYVPAVPSLYVAVLLEGHDAVYSGHLGVHKTLHRIRAKYFWPGMTDMVKEYVSTCPACQQIKAKPVKSGGLLQQTELPTRPWAYVSFDFCTGFPTTKHGCDSVAVWCCVLTKMVHFLPYKKTDFGAAELAHMYLQHIFKLHGLPVKLVSDRDPLFTSAYWQELHKHLHTATAMSSGHHAETNGQTERMNRVLEEMLRHYVGPLMDDWDLKLPMLEFAYNSAVHKATGEAPFVLNYGLQPLSPTSTVAEREFKLPAAQQFCEGMELHLRRARLCLDRARQTAKSYADGKRKAVVFKEGASVMLATEHLQLKLKAPKKLVPKFVGPFTILQQIGPVAYKLDLPPTMRCHNVFHVSQLAAFKKAAAGDSAGKDVYGRNVSCPAGVEVDGELEYFVEAVLDHTTRWGRTWYLVKWLGFGPEHNSWEPANFLEDVQALDVYEAKQVK
jgi:hypothetical protein